MVSEHIAFFKNAAWQYGLQLIKYLLPLITLPYLTRVLEPSGYAIYAYTLSFMGFVQVVVDFGFNLSGTKAIATAESDYDASRVSSAILQARLMLSIIVAFGVVAIGAFIPIIRDNRLYAALAYIAVCGRALAPDFIFQGKEEMSSLTTRYLASKGTSTILTFLFVRSSADLLFVPVLDIISSAIAFFWSVYVARKKYSIRVIWVGFRESVEELKVSGYYFLSNLASSSFSGMATLIIGIAITDHEKIAYWSIAMTGVGAVQALYTPITNSLYPHMVLGGDYQFAKRLAFITLPFIVSGTALFFFLAEWIILVIGGVEYLPGAYVIQMLSPVLLLSFYSMYFGWPVLGAIGKVKELTITTMIAAVVGIIGMLLIWGLGYASITAFAIVRNVTEVVLCVLRVILVNYTFKRCQLFIEHD